MKIQITRILYGFILCLNTCMYIHLNNEKRRSANLKCILIHFQDTFFFMFNSWQKRFTTFSFFLSYLMHQSTSTHQCKTAATSNPDIGRTPPASHMKVHRHRGGHQPSSYHPCGRKWGAHYSRILCVPPICHDCRCKQRGQGSMGKSAGRVWRQRRSSAASWERGVRSETIHDGVIINWINYNSYNCKIQNNSCYEKYWEMFTKLFFSAKKHKMASNPVPANGQQLLWNRFCLISHRQT